jgi:hypothetical protein
VDFVSRFEGFNDESLHQDFRFRHRIAEIEHFSQVLEYSDGIPKSLFSHSGFEVRSRGNTSHEFSNDT